MENRNRSNGIVNINELLSSDKNRIKELSQSRIDFEKIYVVDDGELLGVFDSGVIGAWETLYATQNRWRNESKRDLFVYNGFDYMRKYGNK